MSRPINKKYTNKELAVIAKQYTQRSHFQKDRAGAYAVASKRGLLNKICKHMGPAKNNPYEIEELIKEASKYKSRSEFERKNKKMYSAVINRKLGHIVFKNLPSLKRNPYTYEELIDMFSSCYSLTHFYHVYGKKVAKAAKEKGLFEELKHLFKQEVPEEYSSLEDIKLIAKKYKTFKAFKENEYLAYLSCQRLNVIEEVSALFSKFKNTYKKINKEEKRKLKEYKIEQENKVIEAEVILLSSKYKTPKDFKLNHTELYNLAKKRQLILKCMVKTMLFPKSNYSIEDIYNEAKKYETIGEFLKFKRHLYHMAKEYGVLKDICSHMVRLTRERYTDQELIDFSRRFEYRDDVRKASSAIYTAISNRQLGELAFSHMKPKKFGRMESEVRDFVSKYFECRKYRETVTIPGKSHIKRFEIDILIPSLNKGIEFDGTYWHSPRIIKQKRPHWPEDDIVNYETIKDSYFKSKGISILHIKEEDWIQNEAKCKKRILSFLKTTS